VYDVDDDDDDDMDDEISWSKPNNRVRFKGTSRQPDIEMKDMQGDSINTEPDNGGAATSSAIADTAAPLASIDEADAEVNASEETVESQLADATQANAPNNVVLTDSVKEAAAEAADALDVAAEQASAAAEPASGAEQTAAAVVLVADAEQAEPAPGAEKSADAEQAEPAAELDADQAEPALDAEQGAAAEQYIADSAIDVAKSSTLQPVATKVLPAGVTPTSTMDANPLPTLVVKSEPSTSQAKPCPPEPVGPEDLALALHRAGRALELLQQVLTVRIDKKKACVSESVGATLTLHVPCRRRMRSTRE
jgi:hypothetical protein